MAETARIDETEVPAPVAPTPRASPPVPLIRTPHGQRVLAYSLLTAVVLWALTQGAPPDLVPPADGSWRTVPGGFRDPQGPWGWRAALEDVAVVMTGLLAWAALLFVRARREGRTLGVHWMIQPNHTVQSTFQLLILGYWALYWPDLARQAPLLLALLAFTYLADAVLSWALFGSWRVTVGPLPIVFSTVLFFLFEGPNFRVFFVIFGVALLSRHYVRVRGRHVFNPSALGMSLITLLYLVGHTHPQVLDPRWVQPLPIFHAFALPPNMVEWLFLLGLLSQARFHYVLVTLGAWLGFALPIGPGDTLFLFEPAVFIAILFLITDPKTSPESAVGRYLFGFAYAVTATLLDPVLTAWAGWGGDAKILAVPLVNLMVPALDAVGWRADAAVGDLLQPRYNLVHVALWAFVGWTELSVAEEKAHRFWLEKDAPTDWFNPWITVVDGEQRCADNPVWCRPFSFPDELQMWLTEEPAPYVRVVPHQRESETPH